MASAILKERELTSSFIIDVPMDTSNTGFRQLTRGAVLRRQRWLKSTTFRQEIQSVVLDMPFDGRSLSGKHVDEALQGLKTDTDTVKTLGLLQYRRYGAYTFRGSKRSQNYRGGFNQYGGQGRPY